MKRIFRRWRLWRWDAENLGALKLAGSRQGLLIASGYPSARLQQVIDNLRRERAIIAGEDKA